MNTNEKQLEKQIQRGDFKNRYVIYVRKSTDDEDIQKNSLTFQKQETMQFAQRQEIDIADITLPGFATTGVISEKHSAFKVDEEFEITKAGQMVVKIERPKFRQLLRYLNDGCFKGVIMYCWDRSCRNDSDEVAIKRLIKDGIDIRFVTTTYEASSSGALHMDVDGMFAKHHSRLTSEKVTSVTRQLRAKGICTYRAPVGYLNIGKSDHKPFDPERADQIKDLFVKMASGEWTLSTLERWAKDVGLTMPPARRRRTRAEMLADEDDETPAAPKIARPMTFNGIQWILTNRFYQGEIMGPEPGQWVKSISHTPLVSPKLFAQVQEQLRGRRVSVHYQSVIDLPYRKFVRCSHCHRVFTPYTKKGHVYLRAKCQSDCENPRRNLSVAEIEQDIGTILGHLSFTEEEIAGLEAQVQEEVQEDTAALNQRQQTDIDELELRKKRVRADLSYLRDNRLPLIKSGVYTMESYVAEEEKLNADLQALQSKEQICDQALHDTMTEVVKCSELLKTAQRHYEIANSLEKERFARILFSELFISETSLVPSLKIGLKPFENRFSTMGAPITRISELSAYREVLCELMSEVRVHLSVFKG